MPAGPAGPAAALLVRDDAHPFALSGAWAGGSTLVGSDPVIVAGEEEDPFALLERQPALVEPPPPGFAGGGWVGFLGYGLGALVERLAPPPPAPEQLPPFALAFHDHLLRRDAGGQWWLEALWTPERDEALRARRRLLEARLTALSPVRPASTSGWRAHPSPAGHARAVAACRERIAAGDLFQANLSLRLSARLQGDPLDLWVRGAERLQPDRAAFLRGPWGALASFSPELFLERTGRRVRSAPIKGTLPRSEDPARLAGSAKDRAENVMIVDLVRNDLGRVCATGSVHVGALAQVRPHVGVWHLVSEVEGTLHDGAGDGDLLRATFPPGSVTGAPKVAAQDVISALESSARQAFCGAIGIASPASGLELSVAIRTLEARGDHMWLDVGGAVVHDSDPGREAREALAKAAPLLAAIGAGGELLREAGEGGDGHAPALLRLGARPAPRPDPAAGVFETILVREGEPVALDRHLARLRASCTALGLPAPHPGLAEEAHAAARGQAACRVRIVARPEGLTVAAAPLPVAGGPTRGRLVTLPGGLGAHKWADRRLVDAIDGAVAPEAAILCDAGGWLLEATRAAVLVLDAAGELCTPPLDGRILPSVTRARVVERAAVRERPISAGELREARAIVLLGALRGAEPVAELDGRPVGPPPEALLRTLSEAAARP